MAESPGGPVWTASAPGKVILFGEHAVVYGRPAIALPVAQVRATARVARGRPGSGIVLDLPDVGQRLPLADEQIASPLTYLARLAAAQLGLLSGDWLISLQSAIPLASGMGSGAAAAAAIVRALALASGRDLTPAQVSELVFESEKLFHGTPSGIDNTVVAFERPIWFVRGQPPEAFTGLESAGPPDEAWWLLIADTGIASPTAVTVGDVRRAWQADQATCEGLFDQIGAVARAARQAIEAGQLAALGPLLDANHRLLQQIHVSCAELDALQVAAIRAGALGAKLSGGGRGGNLIALALPGETFRQRLATALLRAGAVRVLHQPLWAAT